MKIVALGGCGQEGSTAVQALLKDEQISDIVVADIDLERAEKFVHECQDARVSALQVDVTKRAELQSAIVGADVVANFVGPYYRFGRDTLRTAIECGVNYVDINDDTDATETCLDLSPKAEEAGVTAVVGLGASPGLSNVLARKGYDLLDHAETIDIRWQVSLSDVDQDAGPSAALLHFLHAIHGSVPQFIDGALTDVPAYSGEEIVEFRSIGAQKAFFTAHPEPWTLSRVLPGLSRVTCKGGVAGLDEIVPALQALDLTSGASLEIGGLTIGLRQLALALLERLPVPGDLPPPMSGLMVSVSGTLNDEPATYRAEVMAPARMTLLTGLPTAAGIALLARGQVKKVGVHPPETAFEPSAFLAQVEAHGVTIDQRVEAACDA